MLQQMEERQMRKPLISLVVTASLLVAACGTTATQAPTKGPTAGPTVAVTAPPIPPDITKTNYKPEPVGKRGGKLIAGISGEPSSIWINIYDNFANDFDVFRAGLLYLWSNTNDLKYYPELTTSVPTTDNGGITVTGGKMDVKVDLIPGAQWSDGAPMTCADVEGMWRFMTDPDQSGTIQGLNGWGDITGVDGGTGSSCVVHFGKVYENFKALWQPLLPAHYLKTSSVKDAVNNLYTQTDPAKGVYSGPYIPTAWAAGAQTDLKANPKFWDTIKKAQAPFDTVTWRYYETTETLIAGFGKGEVDIAVEFNHTNLASIKAANIPDAQVDIVDGPTYEHHSWNFASLTKKFGAPGAKALVEAIKYIYDKNAINQRILGNSATPSCTLTTPQTWFYADIPCYKTDLAKGQEILTKAGFTKGSDGVLAAPNGTKVELLGCTRSDRQYRVDTMILVGNQLGAAGIKVNNQAVNPSVLFRGWELADSDVPCNLTHGNFDFTEFAWIADPDPTAIHALYHSKFDPSQGDHSGQNYIRVSNPDLDRLLDENNGTLDLIKIRDNMRKIQEFYVDPANAFPEIALYNWRTVLLKSPAMHNIANNGSATTQAWNIVDWWKS
jgi:peptide/nickel transport system substrate-binding protein